MRPTFIGILMIIVLLIGCNATKTDDPLRIGALVPMTGSNAFYGEQATKGINIALDAINKEGINSRKLETVFEDSKGQAKDGITAFTKLRGQDVKVFVTMTSAVALAIGPLANQDQVIQMEMGAVAPKYATPDDFTFRTSVNALEYSKGITKALKAKGIDKVCLMLVNSEWGAGMGSAFIDSYHKTGGTVTQKELFDEGSNDMSTQLSKIKAADCDDIVLTSPQPEAGRILRQAYDLNLTKQWYSDSYSVEGQIVLSTAGKSAEGILFVTPRLDLNDKRDAFQLFISGHKARYDDTPSFMEAQAYDAVMLVADAMRSCQEDTSCLKAVLSKTSGWRGASGMITFDQNGDPVDKPMGLKTIKDGNYIEVQQ